MLTGPEIHRRLITHDIMIDPFDVSAMNPNSIDLRLGNTLACYNLGLGDCLDVKRATDIRYIHIPDEGYILRPKTLYLGSTIERIGSNRFVPVVEGKSSLGRLGLSIHVTAGFVDVGFEGNITLEITAVHPLRIYAGMRICQVCFTDVVGDVLLYRGKYQNSTGIIPSKSFIDYQSGD